MKIIEQFNTDILEARNWLGKGNVAVFKNFFEKKEINSVKNDVINLAKIICKNNTITTIKEVSKIVVEQDKSLQFYNACREIPSFTRFISSEKIINFLKKLMGYELINIPFDFSILRLDSHQNPSTNFDWHQDFHYNVISKNALTIWVPCLDSCLEKKTGGLKFSRFSNGKIMTVNSFKIEKKGAPNRLRIANLANYLSKIDDQSESLTQWSMGDLIIFNALVLHKSIPCVGPDPRFTINFRIGSMSEKEYVEKNMYRARDQYPNYFENAFPDYVVN